MVCIYYQCVPYSSCGGYFEKRVELLTNVFLAKNITVCVHITVINVLELMMKLNVIHQNALSHMVTSI